MSIKTSLQQLLRTAIVTIPLTIASALSLQAQNMSIEPWEYHNISKYKKYVRTDTTNGKIALDKELMQEKIDTYTLQLSQVRSSVVKIKTLSFSEDISDSDKKRAIMLQAQEDKLSYSSNELFFYPKEVDLKFDSFVKEHPFVEKRIVQGSPHYVVTDERFFSLNSNLLDDASFFSFYEYIYSDLFVKDDSRSFDYYSLLSKQRDLMSDSSQTTKVLTYINFIENKEFGKAKNFVERSLFGPYAYIYSKDLEQRLRERDAVFKKELFDEDAMKKVYDEFTSSGSLYDYDVFCSHCDRLEKFAKTNNLISNFELVAQDFCNQANIYVLEKTASFDIKKIHSGNGNFYHFVDDLLFSEEEIMNSFFNNLLFSELSVKKEISLYGLKDLFEDAAQALPLKSFTSLLDEVEDYYIKESSVYDDNGRFLKTDLEKKFITDSIQSKIIRESGLINSKMYLEYVGEVFDTCLYYVSINDTKVSEDYVQLQKDSFSKKRSKKKKQSIERHVFLESKKYASGVLFSDTRSPTGFYWTTDDELVVVKNISVPLPHSIQPIDYRFEQITRKTLEEELRRFDSKKFKSGLSKIPLDWDFYIYDIQNTPAEKKVMGDTRFMKALPIDDNLVQVRVVYDVSKEPKLKKFCKEFIERQISLDDNILGILYEDKINSVHVTFSADKDGARLLLEKGDSIVQIVDADATIFSSFSQSSNYADGVIVQTYVGKKKYGNLSKPSHKSLDALYTWPSGKQESYADLYERVVSTIIALDGEFLQNQEEKMQYISR